MTVALFVGCGATGLRFAARPYSPIVRPIANGRMITTGSFYHIQPSNYVSASAPVTHTVMLPIESINLYVGFMRASDPSDQPPQVIPLARSYAYDDTRAITDRIYDDAQTLPISGDDCTGSLNLEDNVDTAVLAPIAKSGVVSTPEAGSIVVTSIDESITLVSNASDFDESTYSLFDGELDADFTEETHGEFPHAVNVFMAGNGENTDPSDPFTMLLSQNASQ
jgi:hypothetical protein